MKELSVSHYSRVVERDGENRKMKLYVIDIAMLGDEIIHCSKKTKVCVSKKHEEERVSQHRIVI